MKKALIVGIDDYPTAPLQGCVNDAIAVANTLEKNGDGSPNFSVHLITSSPSSDISSGLLQDALKELFTGDMIDMALFFFAGHGVVDPNMNVGYIVSQDGKKGAYGVSLTEILGLANNAYPRIKSTVIILDSCHSGFAGEVPALGNDGQTSVIGKGVTILTACHCNGTASENDGHGLFTRFLLDGLEGSASDICGRITPAAVYSHIDQTLGAWEQRPIYKANVQTFVTLRQVSPKISLEILRRLPRYFPDAAYTFPLDPSYEPDRDNIPETLRNIPVNEDHARIFRELQMCNKHGLVVPIDTEHMYYAAVRSTGCKLTALGAHYRKLAMLNRI